ncbi:hypothetical protein [Mycoplasmopsis cricetuli]|uniref:hypothetical protein n=1 Tax=Mycoplasmopsis cricetuli TaxID=171283 RepID=UPI0004729A60|nr:hypothetical protein [Mycoplasmopsis cricetuli]
MEVQAVKTLFIKTISSIPGVVYVHGTDENIDKNEEVLKEYEYINVKLTPKGWDFVGSITILRSIAAKQLIEEIYTQMNFELKKERQKLNNITIFVKGVKSA